MWDPSNKTGHHDFCTNFFAARSISRSDGKTSILGALSERLKTVLDEVLEWSTRHILSQSVAELSK